MRLTELKNKIDEALRIHDDYDLRITAEDYTVLEIEEYGIDRGRFNFNIEVDTSHVTCNLYHVEDDEDMEYCNTCNLYHSSKKDCPECELNELRQKN